MPYLKLASDTPHQARKLFEVLLFGLPLEENSLPRDDVSIVTDLSEYPEAWLGGPRSGMLRVKILKHSKTWAIVCIKFEGVLSTGTYHCALCNPIVDDEAGCECSSVLEANKRGACLYLDDDGTLRLKVRVSEKMNAGTINRFDHFQLSATAFIYEGVGVHPDTIDFGSTPLDLLRKNGDKGDKGDKGNKGAKDDTNKGAKNRQQVKRKRLKKGRKDRTHEMTFESRQQTSRARSMAATKMERILQALKVQSDIYTLFQQTVPQEAFESCRGQLTVMLNQVGDLVDAPAFVPFEDLNPAATPLSEDAIKPEGSGGSFVTPFTAADWTSTSANTELLLPLLPLLDEQEVGQAPGVLLPEVDSLEASLQETQPLPPGWTPGEIVGMPFVDPLDGLVLEALDLGISPALGSLPPGGI